MLWPEKLSPRVSVATRRLPKQKFDSPAQIEFAKKLSYNAWHTIAEHRPLGDQSRARPRMYFELSQLRHNMNSVPHYEPTGDGGVRSGAMTPQSNFMVLAPIIPERETELRQLLDSMNRAPEQVDPNNSVAFRGIRDAPLRAIRNPLRQNH